MMGLGSQWIKLSNTYVGFEAVAAVVMKSSVFWDIMPCSLMKVVFLAACFILVSCLAYSLAWKTEAMCLSKKLADFQQTTWLFIPEDRTVLH
jgi:hypothetical protein